MTDKEYMARAVELAKLGRGWVNPNPMVGAVIVKEGRIIGEGYHKQYKGLHAERNAFASLTEAAEGADLYVTLEPCCHYGNTPPCTEAIIAHKIRRVVIGSDDPNPKVAGKGIRQLREAGILVETEVLKEECDKLNSVFFHYITMNTPYVVMKYAMTADGKIATKTGESKWITGEKARAEVQKLRHQYMGIMVGIGTVLADDPMLNVRVEGMKSPVRIICDSRLRIPLDSRICQTAREYRTIIACGKLEEEHISSVGKNEGKDGEKEAENGMRGIERKEEDEVRETERKEAEDGMRGIERKEEDEVREMERKEAEDGVRGIERKEEDGVRETGRKEAEDRVRETTERTGLKKTREGNEMQKKANMLQKLGVEVVSLPDKEGRVDLLGLMDYLGRQKIDSILLEGGGELNNNVLRAGLVNELKVFIAPKIFGGRTAKTPVGGEGVERPEQGAEFSLERMSLIGEDLLLEYKSVSVK